MPKNRDAATHTLTDTRSGPGGQACARGHVGADLEFCNLVVDSRAGLPLGFGYDGASATHRSGKRDLPCHIARQRAGTENGGRISACKSRE